MGFLSWLLVLVPIVISITGVGLIIFKQHCCIRELQEDVSELTALADSIRKVIPQPVMDSYNGYEHAPADSDVSRLVADGLSDDEVLVIKGQGDYRQYCIGKPDGSTEWCDRPERNSSERE